MKRKCRNDEKCLNVNTSGTNLPPCSLLVFKCTAEFMYFAAVSIDILANEGEHVNMLLFTVARRV